MIYAVHIRPEAEQDLLDASLWYEEKKIGLGHRFLDEASHLLNSISETPQLYPVVHKSTRRALIQRFPFGIYYRVEQTKIVVVAVMHGSRAPRRWKKRM